MQWEIEHENRTAIDEPKESNSMKPSTMKFQLALLIAVLTAVGSLAMLAQATDKPHGSPALKASPADDWRKKGADNLAISHNGNRSNGRMTERYRIVLAGNGKMPPDERVKSNFAEEAQL